MKISNFLLNNPEVAYQYAKKAYSICTKSQSSKIDVESLKVYEKILLSCPNLCLRYSKEAVKGRWPKGEKTIAKDVYASFYYAKDVLKKRFPLAEKLISQDPEFSYKYSREIFKKKWTVGEAAISKSAFFSFLYAKDILKKRFKKGEDSISTSTEYSFYYSCSVLKDKLPIKMHNKMIAAGIENPNDFYAKKYFIFLDGNCKTIDFECSSGIT